MTTTQTTGHYVQIDESKVPDNIRFDVPRRNQGQSDEVAYGQPSAIRDESDHGDPYMRVRLAEGGVAYYRWVAAR